MVKTTQTREQFFPEHQVTQVHDKNTLPLQSSLSIHTVTLCSSWKLMICCTALLVTDFTKSVEEIFWWTYPSVMVYENPHLQTNQGNIMLIPIFCNHDYHVQQRFTLVLFNRPSAAKWRRPQGTARTQGRPKQAQREAAERGDMGGQCLREHSLFFWGRAGGRDRVWEGVGRSGRRRKLWGRECEGVRKGAW